MWQGEVTAGGKECTLVTDEKEGGGGGSFVGILRTVATCVKPVIQDLFVGALLSDAKWRHLAEGHMGGVKLLRTVCGRSLHCYVCVCLCACLCVKVCYSVIQMGKPKWEYFRSLGGSA